jgi:hypothetical protein
MAPIVEGELAAVVKTFGVPPNIFRVVARWVAASPVAVAGSIGWIRGMDCSRVTGCAACGAKSPSVACLLVADAAEILPARIKDAERR